MWTMENRKIIRGCQEHIAAGLGCATDYRANYEEIASPVDGLVQKQYMGKEGGKWLHILDDNGRSWQFAHLSKYQCSINHRIMRGANIAISGNSGTITTAPHLHLQILDKNNNRLNPEIIFKELLSNPLMDKFNRLKEKFIKKFNNPSTIPYTHATPDGSTHRNIIRLKDNQIIEKNDVSVEEWIAAFSVWD